MRQSANSHGCVLLKMAPKTLSLHSYNGMLLKQCAVISDRFARAAASARAEGMAIVDSFG
eukprot:scaffold135601_cov30-Prasinocladus_malaysianus.AAC.1